MHIQIVDDWMDHKISHKDYPLSPQDKKTVDEEFNKMHEQGRMTWSTEPTPFGFPVFVVWKTVDVQGREPFRKGRVVVDIRGLNKITVPDAYPMPLQSDMIHSMRGCHFISTMDGAAFFHQWLVQKTDRHKFTVVSHRGREQMNVAAMGFTGSPAYTQRQMDRILWEFHKFTRAYIDDVAVFSKMLEDHISHL